ncbi:MAG: glycosyltransferase family 4 protein [Planctomycetes bacterium]|nr:glycosyltransferase family 4 protein [Planctomycetota bacterium]
MTIKIAHIVTIYGSATSILDTKLRALDNYDKLDVCVISSAAGADDGLKTAVRHIPVNIARTIKPFADLRSIWHLYKTLKRERFDIIHSHTAKAGFVTAIAGWMAKVPMINHTYHGLPFFDGQNRISYCLYYFLEKIACKLRSHVFTQNKRDMPACIGLTGSASKVSYEGNGVDVEHVRRQARLQLSSALKSYPGEGIKLALLSRLESVKRIEDFLKAVSRLKQRGIDVSCVIAGTGPLEKKLREMLGPLQLDECVNMVGFIDYPHGLIAASDIVILCSEKEGIPRAIMEAMVLGKPVVATDVLGTQELVVDGETGFLVPLGDAETIAQKIELLANDREMREQMGDSGLKRVTSKFNESHITDLLYEFYIKQARESEI